MYRCNWRTSSGAFLFFVLLIGLASSGLCAGITLKWDPNQEADLAGYKLYYKSGNSGSPYSGTDAAEGPSPIDVGKFTEFTVTGLDESQTHYFVVTAYDSNGIESNFSNEAQADPANAALPPQNQPPVAAVGPDMTVASGVTVSLDGSASSDPDDGIASYLWTQSSGTPVDLSNATTPVSSFVAPDISVDMETLEFQLTVTDFTGQQNSANCTIYVESKNALPIGDDVTITTSEYNSTRKKLIVKAVSDAPTQSVVLTAWAIYGSTEEKLGDLSFNKKTGAFEKTYNNFRRIPDHIKVTSSNGGSDTQPCVIR